ncbi:MAG: DUF2127 domain-containing protein [Candidatus Rokuibacteriota bacterium]|nr:MAG: DUF2127 domain-containing protein [Candidatus Rokubacteria bacterium]
MESPARRRAPSPLGVDRWRRDLRRRVPDGHPRRPPRRLARAGAPNVGRQRPAAGGVTRAEGRSALRLIAAFKLLKGLLLATVALGALRLVHDDVAEAGVDLARQLHLDPDGRLVEPALRRLAGIDPRTLTRFSLSALAYAALLLTEAVGLMRGKRWAEYLTIVATSSLVPLEVYELSRRLTATRLAALIVNLVIVAYLVVRVRRESSRGPSGESSSRCRTP